MPTAFFAVTVVAVGVAPCVAKVRAGGWSETGTNIDETILMPGGEMVGLLIDLLADTMVGIATGVVGADM